MKNKTRIMIVDDSRDVRKDLRTLLSLIDSFEFAGEAESKDQAISLIKELKPDLVLVDLDLNVVNQIGKSTEINEMEGYKIIREIKVFNPKIIIFVLTVHGYQEAEQTAFEAGANAFFVKGNDTKQLFDALCNLEKNEGDIALNQQ